MSSIHTFQILLSQFNGAHLVKVHQAGAVIGFARQSTYNAIQGGHFPLPIVKIGTRSAIRLIDIANYLDALGGMQKTRRGRPTKAEQIAKKEAARLAGVS